MAADPYKTLGVSKSATEDEIRKAYRGLAKKFHPDLNPGKKDAEAKFKEINAAYEQVGTKDKREAFDRGEAEQAAGFGGGQGRRQGGSPFFYETQDEGGRYSQAFGTGSGNVEDIFAGLFGGGRFGQSAKGEDQIYKLEVDFRDAVLGAEREIVLGSGKKLRVKIPPGIESGRRLRFQGQGGPAAAKGAAAGDAYVELEVKPSPIFAKKGWDLEMELPVSLAEAVLGAEVKVPTVEGAIMLNIPAGSNSRLRLRVRGKGALNPATQQRGDQYVNLIVMLPPKIDPALKAAIQELAAYNPRQGVSP